MIIIMLYIYIYICIHKYMLYIQREHKGSFRGYPQKGGGAVFSWLLSLAVLVLCVISPLKLPSLIIPTNIAWLKPSGKFPTYIIPTNIIPTNIAWLTLSLPTYIIPTNIAWLKPSGKFPMGLGILPLKHNIMIE